MATIPIWSHMEKYDRNRFPVHHIPPRNVAQGPSYRDEPNQGGCRDCSRHPSAGLSSWATSSQDGRQKPPSGVPSLILPEHNWWQRICHQAPQDSVTDTLAWHLSLAISPVDWLIQRADQTLKKNFAHLNTITLQFRSQLIMVGIIRRDVQWLSLRSYLKAVF